MELSILRELKEFESIEESNLEKKKKEFLKSLEEKKEELLESNELEIDELSSNKNNIIKAAQEKAKEQAESSINDFKEKTKKIEESSNRVEDGVNIIFNEFLNQNV